MLLYIMVNYSVSHVPSVLAPISIMRFFGPNAHFEDNFL